MHWGWAYDGVNSTVPRNCGPECANFLSTRRQWCESILVTSLSIWTLRWAISRVKPIQKPLQRLSHDPTPWFKQLLLVGMTLTFGLELGFKFASRTVIYVLNPCHITTIIQVCENFSFSFLPQFLWIFHTRVGKCFQASHILWLNF